MNRKTFRSILMLLTVLALALSAVTAFAFEQEKNRPGSESVPPELSFEQETYYGRDQVAPEVAFTDIEKHRPGSEAAPLEVAFEQETFYGKDHADTPLAA